MDELLIWYPIISLQCQLWSWMAFVGVSNRSLCARLTHNFGLVYCVLIKRSRDPKSIKGLYTPRFIVL